MTDRRLALVQAAYRGFEKGDFTASLTFLDPSIELVVDPDIPDGGTFHGLAGVREYMTRFLESWELLTITPETIEQEGDVVIAKVIQRAIGRGSGATATLEYFQLWTFRGEKVVHLEVALPQSQPRWRK